MNYTATAIALLWIRIRMRMGRIRIILLDPDRHSVQGMPIGIWIGQYQAYEKVDKLYQYGTGFLRIAVCCPK